MISELDIWRAAAAMVKRFGDDAGSHATPIVFIVDDDVSVRESLELLIRCAGRQPETFASAQDSFFGHASSRRAAWCLT